MTPLAVHHFGPDPARVGGIGSVLRIIGEHNVGGDSVSLTPTWTDHSHLQSGLLTVRALWKVARIPSPDVVHVHLSERGSFVREGAVLILARRRGLTTAATIHGASFAEFARRRPRLVRGVLRHADLVTCLDPEVPEIVRTLVPAARVELVPNPVPLYTTIPAADQTPELVVFAGEIGYRKGADVLCRAWATVARERTGARCVLVGPATDLVIEGVERLETRAPVSPEGVIELLSEARVVALPSRAEAMPMILTEAMSAGRPFIATPVGAIPELAAGGGGMIVPVGDADALAARLIEFLASPAMACSWGERGRSFCTSTRGLEVIDARLRELYASVRYR